MSFYIDNDQVLSMKLTDDTGADITSASITAQVMDGKQLIGNPITLSAVSHVYDIAGNDLGAGFAGEMPRDLSVTWGQHVTIKITANSGGLQGVWYKSETVERRQ